MYFIVYIKYKYCVCVIRAVLHLCSVRNFEYMLISQTAYGLCRYGAVAALVSMVIYTVD